MKNLTKRQSVYSELTGTPSAANAARRENYRRQMEGYRHRKLARRVYSLNEISEMPTTLTKQGYVNKRLEVGVWIGEHVLVAESVLGHVLPQGMTVHHKDGVKDHNDFSNLEIWLTEHPTGIQFHCPNCGWPTNE